MCTTMFFEELIFLDQSFKNSDAFFDFIFPVLKNKGYVRDSFVTAIKKREKQYPTALSIEPYAVALPHTDVEHIIKPFISVTRLNGTMPWFEMANNDNKLDIALIFLLGFIDHNGHINLLQSLMSGLTNKSFTQQLYQAKTPSESVNLLETTINF